MKVRGAKRLTHATGRRVGALAWASFCGAVYVASPAYAEDALARCVSTAQAVLAEGGATALGEPTVNFLTEGERWSTPLTLERNECVGFLAVGHRRVHDLDLVLMTEGGVVLAQDANVDARPYLRFCGAAGLRMVVTVLMYKGQGEVALLMYRDAPPQLPDLGRTVGQCFATSGGIRRPAPVVGAPPPLRSLAEAGAAVAETLAAAGYAPTGTASAGHLTAGLREARAIELEGGRCHAIAAIGDERSGDVDLFVRTASGMEIGRDDSRRSEAVVRLCPDRSVDLVAEVRMFEGGGNYEVRTFTLTPSAEAIARTTPVGIVGSARGRFTEVVRGFARRGLATRPLSWGMLMPGQTLTIPVDLDAGRCYSLSAVSADEAQDGELDLMLLDERGGLLAWDLGRGGPPLLYHCPRESGRYRIRTRLYGAFGRFMLMLGEDQP